MAFNCRGVTGSSGLFIVEFVPSLDEVTLRVALYLPSHCPRVARPPRQPSRSLGMPKSSTCEAPNSYPHATQRHVWPWSPPLRVQTLVMSGTHREALRVGGSAPGLGARDSHQNSGGSILTRLVAIVGT